MLSRTSARSKTLVLCARSERSAFEFACGSPRTKAAVKLHRCASLGVIRLDYDYPPAPGDIDHPGSFGYDVFYRVVPGLTFEICQKGVMPPEIRSASSRPSSGSTRRASPASLASTSGASPPCHPQHRRMQPLVRSRHECACMCSRGAAAAS